VPDLPTLTDLTTDQAQRILAAFSDSIDPDTGEPLTPTQAYRRWLRDRLVAHVLSEEAIRLDEVAETTKRDALAALAASLPGTP